MPDSGYVREWWLGTRQPPRAAAARQHVARSGGAQRLLSEPAAVSPAYPGAMLAGGADPGPGFRWTFPVNEFVL